MQSLCSYCRAIQKKHAFCLGRKKRPSSRVNKKVFLSPPAARLDGKQKYKHNPNPIKHLLISVGLKFKLIAQTFVDAFLVRTKHSPYWPEFEFMLLFCFSETFRPIPLKKRCSVLDAVLAGHFQSSRARRDFLDRRRVWLDTEHEGVLLRFRAPFYG